MTRSVLARVGAALLAMALGAAGIVVAILLLQSEPGPVGNAAAPVAPIATGPLLEGGRIPTPTAPGFPSPPPGATVFAREAGSRALGLAIVPGSPTSLVRVSVLSDLGPGERGLDVSLEAGGASTTLPACGAGCYQAQVPSSRLRGPVAVQLNGARYGFTLPQALQHPDGTTTVARATRVWNALTSLVWQERLGSSPTDVLHTIYTAVAPDELAYSIRGHSSSVIIGTRRWDRGSPTGRWIPSVQEPPITQPIPFWSGVSDARVLGSGPVGGHDAWEVSFFDPGTPAWFDARIDKATGRTLRLRMIAVAHFMYHVYGPFDAPIRLEPPTNKMGR